MKLRLQDIVSHGGRDYVVEGSITYRLGGKVYRLCRVVDGETVRWVEPLTDETDDRILLLDEIQDLDMTTPPPATLSYRGKSYVTRLTGQATAEITGKVPDRFAGACELWRFRAAGDVFIQMEQWSDRVVALAGESVHKNMIEVFPGSS